MKKAFILGNPRSGTSLLRLMLNANPALVSPPECGFAHWWLGKHENWNPQVDGYEQIINDFSASKKIENWHIDFNEFKVFAAERNPNDYAALTALVYEYYGMKRGKTVKAIADKNNYYIHHLNDLNRIWSDACFIHVLRDGRDVACSYLEIKKLKTDSAYKPILPSQITEIAAEWSLNNFNIQKFLNRMDSRRHIVVKYENVIADTENELTRICHFLKVDFDASMLEYFKPQYHDEPGNTMDWKQKTLTPPDSSSVGRYKQMLAIEDITTFENAASDAMLEFGYK